MEPRCSGCGKRLLSYLTEKVADGLRCLRCNAVNKTEETIMKVKREARIRAKRRPGDVQVQGGEQFEVPADFKPNLVDQTAECMHWWRLTGTKGVCKKCGVTRVFGKTEQATEEIRERVLAYVKARSGKKVEWATFAQEIGVSQGRLGLLLRAFIDDGTVIEVDHDKQPFVYRLAHPKVGRRVA